MIQFETVKYGILKKAKDNQKMSKGDSTSSCSEEDVLLPETNTLTDEQCTNMSSTEPILSALSRESICIQNDIKMEKSATTHVELDTVAMENHHNENSVDNDAEVGNNEDDKISKHNEDAANNNSESNEQDIADDEETTEKHDSRSIEQTDNGFGEGFSLEALQKMTQLASGGVNTGAGAGAGAGTGTGYFSLEALQKMAQFVSAAMTNNTDDEDAKKQWLESILFTLQHQQLFQMQLIQQLQSQLSINRTDKMNDDGDDDDDEIDDEQNYEREEGELTEEQMAEEQRKYHEEQKANAIEKENLRLKQQQQQQQQKLNENDRSKENDASKPLNPNEIKPNDTLSAMEASFSSPFASSIITNHDEPSSMDGLNSLEMLQKRTEEVLDSASRGILSGSLTDEMSFKNDGKGRNEPFFKHRCRYCGKVFGSDSALQIHIRSHTGERPFKCNVCGSRFTTKGNLKVHFQRHTQKFPHIHMNPNPIPEHLDKFYPPLLPPPPPGQQPPLSPSPPPPTNRATVTAPALNLPFPPIPGLPTSLQSLQNLHGLPFLRPPFDLLKQMGAHPFFGAMREAVQQHQQQEQETPADLSKPANLTKTQIKAEPKDDEHDNDEIENQETEQVIEKPKRKSEIESPIELNRLDEPIEKHHSITPPPQHRRSPWKDDNKSDGMSPTPSIENYSPKADQPENLSSRLSSKHHSPSSVGSARENHFHDNQNEIKMFPALLPRPGSNDNSWESFIEVDKSSETSKLQQFVDNIESKITEPNECGVCHKVLSCHSALIMHYRTHTGIRPFKCLICGRKFTTKGNLKTHMSVHRMKPPMRTIHQCPVCHKKYSNSLVLQQHIRLHTGEPTDLTLEQISAAEITGMSTSASAFPMGLNPFAFPIPGLHHGSMGPESSNGDNDDFMDEDFEDESNYEDQVSNTGSISGDSNQNISSRLNSSEETHSRAISAMLAEHNKSVENLSRTPSTASHPDSVEEKRSASPQTPQPLSPAHSDVSQGALDLTPRSEPKSIIQTSALSGSTASAAAAAASLGAFSNFPFMHHGMVNTTSPMMTGALNTLAQSVAPMGPFNPMALAGVRGNTTCKICFKTFACQSALEIHYRSHTKERPYKCSICDKAFTTKNEELIHTSLHFQIYGNMKQHMMTHKLRDVPQHMFGSSPIDQSRSMSPVPPKEAPSLRIKTEAELSPRPTANDNNNSRSSLSNQERFDRRERSLPPQFQSQVDSSYHMMLERQHHLQQMQHQHQLHQQQQQQHSRHSPLHLQRQSLALSPPRSSIQPSPQHIKNEHVRQKPSSMDIDQPSAKRQLLSESHAQDIPTSLKEAYQMPPMHEEKTSSHLERLQQFHTSSLLSQPIKLDPPHLKSSATSPGSNDAGDQKHFCHLCQKNFSSTSSLQIHMRTHTGERPFVCNVCQKAFTTKGNLKVHMGIHTWSGASRRGRRMSLELPFNGSMPLMLQSPEFLQRHSDFFHPYPPAHLLGRMQQSMSMEHQQQKIDRDPQLPPPPPQPSQIINLANKYINSNGLARSHAHNNHREERQPQYNSNPSSPADSDKQQISPNSLRDESRYTESPKRNGDRDRSSPIRAGSTDLSPRMWKLHYESKAVNRDGKSKNDEQNKAVEELIA